MPKTCQAFVATLHDAGAPWLLSEAGQDLWLPNTPPHEQCAVISIIVRGANEARNSASSTHFNRTFSKWAGMAKGSAFFFLL